MKRDKLLQRAREALASASAEDSPRYSRKVLDAALAMQAQELERRNVELSRAMARYTNLFQWAPTALVELDAALNLAQTNRAAATLLGLDPERAKGSPLSRFIADADTAAFHQFIRQCNALPAGGLEIQIQTETSLGGMNADNQNAATSGQTKTVWLEASRLASTDGDRFLVSLIDHSQLRGAQNSLVSERERGGAIFEAALDGIICVEADCLVTDVNRAAERLLGIAREEVIGQRLTDLLPNLLVGSETLNSLLDQERAIEAVHHGGRSVPISVSLARLGTSAGSPLCAFVRDLTAVRKAEQELRHAHKMEAIGTLAAGVAHDFNNLLMGVRGCAEIAMDALGDPEIARLYLQEVLDAASNGAEITRQLLAFSRKGEDLRPEVFKLDPFIDRQATMLRRLIGEDVSLLLELGAPKARLRIDPSQLVQVLMNLAVNARDAMDGVGQLDVSTEVLDKSSDTDVSGQCVAIDITDSGPGMSQEVQMRIFDPFFTTKPDGEGTGLGLSTVYGIVTKAGGSISCSSSEGQGTSFRVTFPTSTRRITEEFPASLVGMIERGTERILLVEDEARVRLVLRNYLERAGYRVHEAQNGPTAIEHASTVAEPIDLLITDMVLPKMNGKQIASEIGHLHPQMKVLFASAHDRAWLVERRRLDPDARLIQKPMELETLLSAVRDVLDDRPPSSAEKASPPRLHRPRPAADLAPTIGRVLVVEDSKAARMAISEFLRFEGWDVVSASSGADATSRFSDYGGQFDALLTDIRLPDMTGDVLAGVIREASPEVAVVYMSGYPLSEPLNPPGPLLEKPIDLEQIADLLAEATASAVDGG